MSLDMNHIYKGYFDTAIGIASRYVRDHDTAKDVAQESMIKIWQKQHYFKPNKYKFFTWFNMIVINTAIDRYRKDTARVMLRSDEAGLNFFECDCINVDTIDMISNLNKLQPKYTEVLSLSFIHGHTQVKIAELLEIPLGTVKSRMKAGMRELRKIYL